MDKDTILQFKKYAETIDTNYKHKLERLLGDPRYEIFQVVLETMIELNIRLEQEAQML